MWVAILVTLLAATGNNIGKALQKEAVHSLPRFSVQPAILRQYLRHRLWLTGLAADLGGALMMIVAFALAPVNEAQREMQSSTAHDLQVSLVQPISGLGLVSLAVFSHFYLKERLAAEEWLAVATSMLGTLGLGVSSEDAPPKQEAGSIGVTRVLRLGLCFLVLGALILYGSRMTSPVKRKLSGGSGAAASIHGLQAGVCFGLSAACCKTGIQMISNLGWLAFPAGLLVSVLVSSLGFMLQTLGLKEGNTVIVCTCAAVSSMATGVVVGLLALGESLPLESSMKSLRLLSWIVTMIGVSALANGKGGFREVARFGVSLLPQSAQRRFLTHKFGLAKDAGLPSSDLENHV